MITRFTGDAAGAPGRANQMALGSAQIAAVLSAGRGLLT